MPGKSPSALFDVVASLRKAVPFRTFTLKLSDGDSLRINHPECIALHPDYGLAVGIDAEGQPFFFDTGHLVSVKPTDSRRRRKRR